MSEFVPWADVGGTPCCCGDGCPDPPTSNSSGMQSHPCYEYDWMFANDWSDLRTGGGLKMAFSVTGQVVASSTDMILAGSVIVSTSSEKLYVGQIYPFHYGTSASAFNSGLNASNRGAIELVYGPFDDCARGCIFQGQTQLVTRVNTYDYTNLPMTVIPNGAKIYAHLGFSDTGFKWFHYASKAKQLCEARNYCPLWMSFDFGEFAFTAVPKGGITQWPNNSVTVHGAACPIQWWGSSDGDLENGVTSRYFYMNESSGFGFGVVGLGFANMDLYFTKLPEDVTSIDICHSRLYLNTSTGNGGIGSATNGSFSALTASGWTRQVTTQKPAFPV